MPPSYFPIKTDTACQLKWNWSTVSLYNSSSSSCHRASIDNINVENFDEFHNTPLKIKARNLMLDNQWPSGGCEYCQKIESAGGSSDRMFHLSIPDQYPPELDIDPNAVYVSPKILEVYFDNVCNMSCVYCWDGFSSKIQTENLKFGTFEKSGIVIENKANRSNDIDQLTLKLWSWLEKNHLTLNRFHVLGGEPFYQPQFLSCLDFFNKHPSPNLEFNVISNIMIKFERLTDYVDRVKTLVEEKKIKRFDLTVSIDCFGAEQEYVRHGIDLDIWRKNFEYLVSQDWICLNINQTITGLTIKTMPELIQYINRFKKHREIGHYFSVVVFSHECLHPGIFGPDFFSQDFDKILNQMRQESWQEKQAFAYMTGIKSLIESCKPQPEKIKQLVVLLDEIDRRRNLNWRNVFPWLEEEVKNVV
jgi:organic radical activating enzyme